MLRGRKSLNRKWKAFDLLKKLDNGLTAIEAVNYGFANDFRKTISDLIADEQFHKTGYVIEKTPVKGKRYLRYKLRKVGEDTRKPRLGIDFVLVDPLAEYRRV